MAAGLEGITLVVPPSLSTDVGRPVVFSPIFYME